MTIATPILAYLQIILGAQVRHIAPDAAPQTFQMFVFFHIAIGLALSIQIIAAAVAFLRSQLATKISASAGLGTLWPGFGTSGTWLRHVDREIRLAGDFVQRRQFRGVHRRGTKLVAGTNYHGPCGGRLIDLRPGDRAGRVRCTAMVAATAEISDDSRFDC